MSLASPNPLQPSFALSVERLMLASASELYVAWTQGFERWFALPGTLRMEARVDAPYYFATEHAGERHAHYGRFVRLQPGSLVELTWVTAAGTRGAETLVTVALAPQAMGTRLTLQHAGFPDAALCQRHREAWPVVLAHLDQVLGAPPRAAGLANADG
jgi:uncharacterized protein YndB with AHSA1/START domain